jgi:integrase
MRFLTQEELKRLFAVIKNKRDKTLFLLAYRHGLRASEIGLLQRTDLDLKQGRITIHRLKGSLSGIYPLQPGVIKLLRAYLRSRTDSSPYLFISNRGVPIDRRTLWCAMDRYRKKAGSLWRSANSMASSTPLPPTSSTRAESSSLSRTGLGTRTFRIPSGIPS